MLRDRTAMVTKGALPREKCRGIEPPWSQKVHCHAKNAEGEVQWVGGRVEDVSNLLFFLGFFVSNFAECFSLPSVN